MPGLEHESGKEAISTHFNSIIPDDEKIYFLKNLNCHILKIIIDINAFLEVVDISRVVEESDLSLYLLDQGISLASFHKPEQIFEFFELEKRRLEDRIQKNLVEIKILQLNRKHHKKNQIADMRLSTILTETQFMIIIEKLAAINFLPDQEIRVVRTLVKCSDTTAPFNHEAFKNNKIKINGTAIQLSVIWDWLITQKYITVDENRKFECANDYFRNKYNQPFKNLRKSFHNYEKREKTYPELELLFRVIQRELFPIS